MRGNRPFGISDKLQVVYPTSSPWVTSVGGTSLAIGPDNNYEWELPWGTLLDPLAADGTSWAYPPPPPYNLDTYDGSSGGGVSTVYRQPWYQKHVVPDSLATAVPEGTPTTPMRVVPDVSALADPSTGMLVGQTTLQPNGTTYAFSLSRIGGTSVASPTFAGIEADAQQAAGHELGFANPVIYARYGSQAFHDVTQNPTGQYEVRNNYTDPSTAAGPLITYLRRWESTARVRRLCRRPRGTTTRQGSARPAITSSRSPVSNPRKGLSAGVAESSHPRPRPPPAARLVHHPTFTLTISSPHRPARRAPMPST